MSNNSAHIIVLGNEKGGTGKSTLAMHIVVGLLQDGKKVGVIDLDARQKSTTRYLENRFAHQQSGHSDIEVPKFTTVRQSQAESIKAREQEEQTSFHSALSQFNSKKDFIIIDCPGNDTYLSRLAHALADTLITPLNDSFVDLDLLGQVSPDDYQVKKISFYSDMVWQSRKYRSASGKPPMDWVVVRSRLASIESRNNKRVHAALESLQKRVMFRYVPGIYERVVYRELFPTGLTVLDDKKVNNLSHVSAREEVRTLIENLRLY
ncbi:MAG: ATPase [Cycloclasticus sp. symbiont of Poecilosclerida sp. M]|nr:MAG: ATPase [Cycloclasticus sp. symbiont of Poecilosclerida sp. M]